MYQCMHAYKYFAGICVFIVDMNSNPSGGFVSGASAPMLLILGYANGIQVWMIPVSILLSQTKA